MGVCPCRCKGPPVLSPCGVCGGIHLVSGTITDANGTWPWVWNALENYWQAVPTHSYAVSGWTGTSNPATGCCNVDTNITQYYGYTLQCIAAAFPTPAQLGLTAFTWGNACGGSPVTCVPFPASSNIPFSGYPGGPWHATDLPAVAAIATVHSTPTCTGGTSLTASFSWTWAGGLLPAPATSATVNFTITTP